MQMACYSNSRIFVLLGLITSGILTDGLILRSRDQTSQRIESAAVALNTTNGDVSYKVIKKSSIDRNATMDCLCETGTFWHWRINACVKQGGWGYECGFFPGEHHGMVCIDGMKCHAVEKTQIEYTGYPGSKPASCQHCKKEDNCLTGEKRHDKTCLKEYILSGSACQTVRVTTMHTASAEVTEKVTKKSTASAKKTATASHKATVTEEHTAEDTTKEATASATKEVTAEGKATVEAEGSGEHTAKKTAIGQGEAEAKACVTVDEVKEFMELKKVPHMGAVLSSKVVSTGDELAFDKAYAKALAAAQKAGLLDAKEAARAAASAKAREHAGLDAKAKADEAAAWKAEAGAEKDAQEKAKAKALAEAEEAARKEAAAAAKAAAEAAAKAAAAKKGTDAAAKAQADADAATEAAAEAKEKQEAIADYLNPKPTQAPERPTTPTTTLAPRKIPAKDIAAKLP